MRKLQGDSKNQKCCNQMRFASIIMQQNATAAGASALQGSLQRCPDPLAGFKGPLCGGRGGGRKAEGKGGEGQ